MAANNGSRGGNNAAELFFTGGVNALAAGLDVILSVVADIVGRVGCAADFD